MTVFSRTLFLIAFLASGPSRGGGDLPYSILNIPDAVMGDSCVEPVRVMRERHMELLFHQRDKTMYAGARDEKHSLIGCLSCHTQKDSQGKYIPISDKGQFCEVCHAYTAVKIDCFQCHAAAPANELATGSKNADEG